MARAAGAGGDVLALGIAAPATGVEVCRLCHGPARRGASVCWCCRAVGSALGERRGADGPVGLVVPVALCRPGDALHAVLRRYKDAPSVSARRHFSAVLGLALSRFADAHGPCLEAHAGSWDAIAVVPSSTRACRATDACAVPSPFDAVLAHATEWAVAPRVVLRRGAGRAGHLRPAADAYVAGPEAAGRRVLLLDDTWVTGARARSAAACLEAAGATVVAVTVLARTVDTGASARLERWWAGQEARAGAAPGVQCCLPACRAARGAGR